MAGCRAACVDPDGVIAHRFIVGDGPNASGKSVIRAGYRWECSGYLDEARTVLRYERQELWGPGRPEDCWHAFYRSSGDHMTCGGCGIRISGETIAMLVGETPYNRKLQTVSDDATRLLDENKGLLVENAKLRRELEHLQRRLK